MNFNFPPTHCYTACVLSQKVYEITDHWSMRAQFNIPVLYFFLMITPKKNCFLVFSTNCKGTPHSNRDCDRVAQELSHWAKIIFASFVGLCTSKPTPPLFLFLLLSSILKILDYLHVSEFLFPSSSFPYCWFSNQKQFTVN